MERPYINETDVIELAWRLYGLTVTSQKPLASYDDKNILIYTNTSSKNPNLTRPSSDGYVLKILNSVDSTKLKFIDAMHAAIFRTSDNGILTPRPIANCEGRYFSIESFPTSEMEDGAEASFIVRLFEYLPGELLLGKPYTPHLCYSVGQTAGRLNNVLKVLIAFFV